MFACDLRCKFTMESQLLPSFAGGPRPKLESPEDRRSHNFDFLTPPSSGGCGNSSSSRTMSETPRSHRIKPKSLPSEFHAKVKIFNDDHRLSTIEEELDTDAKNKRHWKDLQCTPKKRQKFIQPLYTSFESIEQKENSPIKMEMFGLLPTSGVLVLKVPKENSDFLSSWVRKDVISCLAKRNMFNIIKKVFQYLDQKDILNIANVSSEWNQLVTDLMPKQYLTKAKKDVLVSKENIIKVPSASSWVKSKNEKTPIKFALSEVNVISPKRRLPLSPQMSPNTKRFRFYLQEGKNLMPSEHLMPCPKCRYPARIKGDKAECCKCHHSFCPQCRWPHPGQKCTFVIGSPVSPSPPGKSHRPALGSKASKKALRRL